MRNRLAVLLARLAQGRSPRVWSLLCGAANRLYTAHPTTERDGV